MNRQTRQYRRDASRRERARQSGSEFDRTLTEDMIYSAYGEQCHYCGVTLDRAAEGVSTPTSATVDHLIPFSRGGGHVLENVRPACFFCNASKGRRTAEEFLSDGNGPDRSS